MEKIEKEIQKTTTTKVVTFVAKDGTEFSDENECKIYEKSAECAYRTLLKGCLEEIPLRRADKTIAPVMMALDNVLDDCREESTYYRLVLKSNEDKRNFIAWLQCLDYFGLCGDKDFWTEEGKIYNPYTSLEELELHKIYLIIRTYDSNYFRIYSKEKIIDALSEMFESFKSGSYESNSKSENCKQD